MANLVQGIGINDGKYPSKINSVHQKEYRLWQDMLTRCSKTYFIKRPTYINVTCSNNFKNYSYFYEWCQKQIGFGCIDGNGDKWCLDKDLLSKDSKVYSENTCVFIPIRINTLLVKSNATRGEYPIGVRLHRNKYKATCNNEFGDASYLGSFFTAEEAFKAYKEFKEAIIKKVANEYKSKIDQRAYNALICYEVNIED